MAQATTDVSVIIPCYNAGEYLLTAVDSVAGQANDQISIEILVVDDHSDDPATLDALKKIKAHENLQVLENTGSRGPGAARNVGIRKATGEWIAFLDADDFYTNNSIGCRLAALDKFPEATWIGGDVCLCDQDGAVFEDRIFKSRPRCYAYTEPAYLANSPVALEDTLDTFLDVTLLNTTSSLIRRERLEAVGGFDGGLILQQDLHLYLRIAKDNQFVFVPEVVAINRQHGSNSTRSYSKTLRWRHAALSLLASDAAFSGSKRYREKLSRTAAQLSNQYLMNKQYLHGLVWRLVAKAGIKSGKPS